MQPLPLLTVEHVKVGPGALQPLGSDAGELRLFHRRHLLRRGELGVQGTVVRLRSPLQARTFDSAAEHREYLAKHAVPHSSLRRMLLFLRNARTFDANTLRYLWIEAGFDHGGERASRPQ